MVLMTKIDFIKKLKSKRHLYLIYFSLDLEEDGGFMIRG